MTSAGPALSLEGVCVVRRGHRLLRDVTFEMEAGQVHALLGHNGAGKTTLFRAVAGLVPVRVGRIVKGGDPSVLFVGSRFPSELRVRDLLEYCVRSAATPAHIAAHVRQVTGVEAFGEARCGELSTGMAQRVALTLALFRGERTLLLDEPTTGLDPQAVDSLLDLVRALRADGCTVVLCSHDLAQLELVCDTVVCLREGRVTASGSVAEIASRVPRARHVVRTSDDKAASKALRDARIDCETTSRGVIVDGSARLDEMCATVGREAEVIEVTVERTLFDRIFDEFAAAPLPARRHRRVA